MKKNRTLLIIAATQAASVSGAWALTGADCKLINQGDRKSTFLPDAPSYFAKPLGVNGSNGLWGAWIGSGNKTTRIDGTVPAGQNTPVTVSVPGSIDPVWSPPKADGSVNWLTLPGIEWYRASEILRKATRGEDADDTPAVLADDGLGGVYQSIALLPDQKTYRAVTEEGGGSEDLKYRDYEEYTEGGVLKIRPKGPQKVICEGVKMQLPMISKTGNYLAGYNPETITTQIYRVKADTTCDLVLDMGMPSGKVEFNFDDTAIAFHVDAYVMDTGEHGGWFSGVSDNLSRNVYVAKLKKLPDGKLKVETMARMTSYSRKGEGGYYPAFFKDGSKLGLAWLTAKYPQGVNAGSEGGKQYAFETVGVDGGSFTPYLLNDDTTPAQKAAMLALGSLWTQSCSQLAEENLDTTGTTAIDQTLLALSLSPAGCKKMVEETWGAKRSGIIQSLTGQGSQVDAAVLSSLTQADIVNSCPRQGLAGTVTVTGGGGGGGGIRRTAPQIFEGACRDCHLATGNQARLPGDAKYIDFTKFFADLEDLSTSELHTLEEWIDGAKYMVEAGTMPPGASLEAVDQATIVEHMTGKKAEIQDRKRALQNAR